MKIMFETPTQVKFFDPKSQETLYGIGIGLDGIDDRIICACCGGVFEVSEVENIEILPWIDLSDATYGN